MNIIHSLLLSLGLGLFNSVLWAHSTHSHDKPANDSHEHHNQVHLDAEMRRANQITVAEVSGGQIKQILPVYGKVVITQDAISHVTAQFPGRIARVNVNYGDKVKTGQVLAMVESNASLQTYAIKAPLAGIITVKHATAGEIADRDVLFTITDTTALWAELPIFASQLAKVKRGQTVSLHAEQMVIESTITQLIPNDVNQPYLVARVPLSAENSRLFPGQLIRGEIVTTEKTVALRIPNQAIQTYEGQQVVFIQQGDEFRPQAIELGISDTQYSEVVSGLAAGQVIVVNNSYLIKADLEKAGAEHSH